MLSVPHALSVLLNLAACTGSGQSGPWTRSQAASNRRRSTLGGDMTGRLLADDFEPDVRVACLLPDDIQVHTLHALLRMLLCYSDAA